MDTIDGPPTQEDLPDWLGGCATVFLWAAIGTFLALGAWFAFCFGQDHPRPGTVIDAKTGELLVSASRIASENVDLKRDNKNLVQENEWLKESIDNLSKELEESESRSSTAPVQTFAIGTAGAYRTRMSPLGHELVVKARFNKASAAEEFWARISYDGTETEIPLNGRWVGIGTFSKVRYLTNPDTHWTDGWYGYRDLEFAYDPLASSLACPQ